MSKYRSPVALCVLCLLVAGCAQLPGIGRPDSVSAPVADVAVRSPDGETIRPVPRPGGAAPGAVGLSPDALDRTSDEERAAAMAPPTARTQLLGETLASLGAATDAGLWLRTGLVSQTRQGRIETADGARSLRVELRPSGAAPGAGSQLSLAAFRSLEQPLTALVQLRVFAE